MTKVSFLHSGYPNDCISPNLLVIDGWESFPQRSGTGFFAKRGQILYYLTARHCLTKDPKADINQVVGQLHVPIRLSGHTSSSDDYVSFDEVVQMKHNSPDISGELVDLVVLSVAKPKRDRDRAHLLARAAKLPPEGKWLDEFIKHPLAAGPVAAGSGINLSGIGYPYDGTATDITYPVEDFDVIDIHTQPAKFVGQLSHGTSPERLMLKDVTWDHDLNGFSGSPVFVGYRPKDGPKYALAGMIVSGGGGKAQFIRISVIAEAFRL